MLNTYPPIYIIIPLSQADLRIESGRKVRSAQSSFGNFRGPASIPYESICWTAPLNLLVKSRMDSSSRLKMVCRELMFPFCRTEHRYWETNAAHSSLNILIDLRGSLWNQARAGPFRLAGNTLHNRRSSPALSIIA